MPLKELDIVNVKNILNMNLNIPDYQRPYRWSKESAAVLFDDLFNSFKNNITEYRIGSVILCSDNRDVLDIVDGQQRLTSLIILLTSLSKDITCPLLNKECYNDLSIDAIKKNKIILDNKCKDLNNITKEKFKEYIYNNCTFVKIVTDMEQEAFQFFDSQNSRGKELSPHDLLKSYHLREMNCEAESFKNTIISKWENTRQDNLADFFYNNLYPLVQWFEGRDGLYYSSRKIKTFKGIKKNNSFNFSTYHKAAQLYIEHFNLNGEYELTNGREVNQFQITQPIIAGHRFFLYSLHYYKLYRLVCEKIKNKYNTNLIPDIGTGDRYIKNLFINLLIFFADKFSFETLNDKYISFFYRYAYSLRLIMHSVYQESINKYVLGKSEKLNKGKNLFNDIYKIQYPEELDTIILDPIENFIPEKNKEKYKEILELLRINNE